MSHNVRSPGFSRFLATDGQNENCCLWAHGAQPDFAFIGRQESAKAAEYGIAMSCRFPIMPLESMDTNPAMPVERSPMKSLSPAAADLEPGVDQPLPPARRPAAWAASLAVLGAVLLGLNGCQAPQPTPVTSEDAAPATSMKLSEGDIVRIIFPGATNLNMLQQIRRDGKMSLPFVGELTAAGLTPAELEKEVLRLYEDQLLQKEVRVSLDSSAYPVYVTGAVLRPGKIMLDRPMTALEAISEAGINHGRANLKKVTVTRREEGTLKHYKLNLQDVLEGRSQTTFYLKPGDVIFVPEKKF